MGRILGEVKSDHLAKYPDEELLLRPFLQSFDVTWARRRRAFGSDLSVYFLKPEPHMERAFGFESEIITVCSPYATLQPRTIQAIERFISEAPALGRVDTMIAFLISEMDDPVSWVKQYMASNPESRLVAAFSAADLRNSRGDSWIVRTILSNQLYQRDLFDHRLPINSDYFFFGREGLIFDLHNAFKRSENQGLFGLRKTGKTSVFFKLRRIVESSKDSIFIYIDCKFPPNRSLRWDKLLARLATQLLARINIPSPESESHAHASDFFLEALRRIGDETKIALVFDEIEYISPNGPLDKHWADDFIPFWQTIGHAQSVFGNLAVFIGGVNPTIVEQDLVGDAQNPLFGIVPHQYLSGLSIDEVRRMLRTLGRPMGLRFQEDAVEYMVERYGGHPLLTRIACSIVHKVMRDSERELPRIVTKEWLLQRERSIESELSFYCGHVVSELKLFYPDEYELLTELVSGNLADVYELAVAPRFTAHLNNYGLLRRSDTGRPSLSIPVLEKFLQQSVAREKGLQTVPAIQLAHERPDWLAKRVISINDNLEYLQEAIDKAGRPKLFGVNSYPESHKFFDVDVVDTEQDFASFINTCNRCFVESIEVYGKSINSPKYFWDVVMGEYPELAHALRRIKVYRHHRVHIKLQGAAVEEMRFFLDRDLNGRQPSTEPELWFLLQQCVLDDLLVGILLEIDRLT